MKKLKINVSKNPMNDAIVNYKSVGIKKKLFSKLQEWSNIEQEHTFPSEP